MKNKFCTIGLVCSIGHIQWISAADGRFWYQRIGMKMDGECPPCESQHAALTIRSREEILSHV